MKKSLLLMIVFAFIFAGTSPFSFAGDKLYTSSNLWYELDRRGNVKAMSGINYKTGSIIPAGTEVTNVSIGRGRRGASKITFAASGKKLAISFQPKYHPGLDVKQFKDRLFTSKSLAKLTKGFSKKEMKCVNDGKVRKGIRKKAVLVTYGYPPEHETSSTDENVWKFWMNRFKTKLIHFDKGGKTISPPKPEGDDEL